MSWEIHIDWLGKTELVGRLYAADRGPSVSFEYATAWLKRAGAFAIDPIRLPLQPGPQHSPFLSGASLLGLSAEDPGAYTRLADGIRQFGHDVPGDLRELWRRLVFSLLASNYDDHLRNHGFLMHAAGRWSLSTAYDLNPVPEIDRVRVHNTPVSEEQNEPSLAGALEIAARFGLKPAAAKTILREVFTAVSGWRTAGRQLRIKRATLDAYASAFEHKLTDEARKLLAK